MNPDTSQMHLHIKKNREILYVLIDLGGLGIYPGKSGIIRIMNPDHDLDTS